MFWNATTWKFPVTDSGAQYGSVGVGQGCVLFWGLSHEEAVKCWDYGQVHLDTRRFNSHGFYFLRKGFGTVVLQILVSSFIK